jgi:hypothetical protein
MRRGPSANLWQPRIACNNGAILSRQELQQADARAEALPWPAPAIANGGKWNITGGHRLNFGSARAL